ncbi:MAG: MFS transporter, partial [Paralcaligenes sp.]
AIVAVVGLWGFVRHIGRTAQPFIAPRLIYGPGFGVVNLINMLYGGVIQGVVALVPLYATNRYGFDALASGTLLIAQGAAAILFSLMAALALRRTGYRLPLYCGSVLIAIGVFLLATGALAGISPYVWLACSTFLIGTGSGIVNPASRNAGLQLAVDQSATIAALRSGNMQIGSILTVSIATAVVAGTSNPGIVQAGFYVAVGVLLLLAVPLIARVPDHHGAW